MTNRAATHMTKNSLPVATGKRSQPRRSSKSDSIACDAETELFIAEYLRPSIEFHEYINDQLLAYPSLRDLTQA